MVVCTQWQGSVECRGWVLDCSAGPYIDYWNPSVVIQTGWIKKEKQSQSENAEKSHTQSETRR